MSNSRGEGLEATTSWGREILLPLLSEKKGHVALTEKRARGKESWEGGRWRERRNRAEEEEREVVAAAEDLPRAAMGICVGRSEK